MPTSKRDIAAKPEQTVGEQVEIKADKVAPAKSCALPEPYRRVDEDSPRHTPVDLSALRFKLAKDRMKKRACSVELSCRAKSREHYRDLAVHRRQKERLTLSSKALAVGVHKVKRDAKSALRVALKKSERALEDISAKRKLVRTAEPPEPRAAARMRVLISPCIFRQSLKPGIKQKAGSLEIDQRYVTVKRERGQLLTDHKTWQTEAADRRSPDPAGSFLRPCGIFHHPFRRPHRHHIPL